MAVVLDSSFLVAYHNRRDVNRPAAAAAMADLVAGTWGRALLLEYVFVEVVTVLLVRRDLATATSVAALLLESREADFVPCSEVFGDPGGLPSPKERHAQLQRRRRGRRCPLPLQRPGRCFRHRFLSRGRHHRFLSRGRHHRGSRLRSTSPSPIKHLPLARGCRPLTELLDPEQRYAVS